MSIRTGYIGDGLKKITKTMHSPPNFFIALNIFALYTFFVANIINEIFKDKKLVPSRLLKAGFKIDSNLFVYTTVLPKSGFIMNVTIDSSQKEECVKATVTDPLTNEPYTLHLLEKATGSFVGSVKEDYKAVLESIACTCFENDVFKFPQTIRLIDFIKNKYGTEPEYLWKNMPKNAVFRRPDNKKWFLAILTAKKSCLYSDSDKIVELVDFKIKEENLIKLSDKKNFFPAYHMNKKKWCSVILDDSVLDKTLFSLIQESFDLAGI